MNKQIEKLRKKLMNDLFEIERTENSLEKLTRVSKIMDRAIQDLNHLLENYKFSGDEEEILFFKTLRPEIIALRIEEIMRFNLTVNKPIGTHEIQLKYYENELKALQSFFSMNPFQYQYYRNGLSDLDRLYFLRKTQPLSLPLADISDSDPAHSTPVSSLFAKFIAYEHIQYFIVEKIAPLKFPELNQNVKNTGSASDLKWTGDSINIVELAYGIWLTGQLNNGNASLNQIVRWLESNLDVSLGVVQRRFIEIERRKRLSPTKYIDQMREAINQKIESGHE
jgi:hypothetical protein